MLDLARERLARFPSAPVRFLDAVGSEDYRGNPGDTPGDQCHPITPLWRGGNAETGNQCLLSSSGAGRRLMSPLRTSGRTRREASKSVSIAGPFPTRGRPPAAGCGGASLAIRQELFPHYPFPAPGTFTDGRLRHRRGFLVVPHAGGLLRHQIILFDMPIRSMLKTMYGFICIGNDYDVQCLVVG